MGDGDDPGMGAIDIPGVSALDREAVRRRLDYEEGHGDGGRG